MMKNTKTTLAAATAIIFGSIQVAQAHTSFVSSDAIAGKSFFGTLNVGHGCSDEAGTHFDTERLEVEMPTEVTELNSIRPMDTSWAMASVVKNDEGKVTKLVWTKAETAMVHSEDSHLYRASFNAKLPNASMTMLAFPVTQYCHDAAGNEITAEWKDASAPTLKLHEAHSAGWNKYTASAAIDEDTIKSFFADALIVWSGNAAYSANAVTAGLISAQLTAIPLGAEFWVKY